MFSPQKDFSTIPVFLVQYFVVHGLAVVRVVAVAAPQHPPAELRQGDDQNVTDRLLNKMEKEQTNFDVQIGDGMDIGIVGENGNLITRRVRSVSDLLIFSQVMLRTPSCPWLSITSKLPLS